MCIPSKTFRELTTEEAGAIVREIVRTAYSEEEIRTRLTRAGFNGPAAAICSHSYCGMFQAMVMICGPRGEIISA